MDYDTGRSGKRKSKNDKKAKGRHSRYKKGGGRRSGGRTKEENK